MDKNNTAADKIDRIASRHHCTVTTYRSAGDPARTVIEVDRRYSRGNPQDAQVIDACLAEIEAAGISTIGWRL